MSARDKAKAQSLIEFALLIPILFVVVMGLFDIGRAVFYYAVLNSAVREGTRYAIVQPDCDFQSDPESCSGGYPESYPLDCNDAVSAASVRICDEIRDKLFNIGDLSSSTITIDKITDVDDPVFIITIEKIFEPITPGLGLIGTLPLRVNSQMLITPIALP